MTRLVILLLLALAAVAHGQLDDSLLAACKKGKKKCGKKCIPSNACCTNNTPGCPKGYTCRRKDAKCILKCNKDQKKCGSTCISKKACCTNKKEGCAAKKWCVKGTCKACAKCENNLIRKNCGGNSAGTCGCGKNQQKCGKQCIAGSDCCVQNTPGCPSKFYCSKSKCIKCKDCPKKYQIRVGCTGKKQGTCQCAPGFNTCKNGQCKKCCNNSQCDKGYTCKNGQCVAVPSPPPKVSPPPPPSPPPSPPPYAARRR